MTEPSKQSDPLGEAGREQSAAQDPAQEKERAWHEWMMVAVGLTGLLAVLAIILSFVALGQGNGPARVTVAAPASPTPASAAATSVPATPPEAVKLVVKADSEHGRLGPDGKWHDAFLPADFAVRAGAKVTVTVYNYDSGPHTFTAPSLGVDEVIPSGGGSLTAAPKEVSFTFTAPSKPGRYAWWCTVPCDPWAMSHDGYMRGYVTVNA